MLICVAASLLQGTTGFGFGLLSMALFPLILPYHAALVVSSMVAAFVAALTAIHYRYYINFKILLIPSILSIGISTIGVAILTRISVDMIKTVLGYVFIGLAVYFFATRKKPIYFKPSFVNGILIGSITGLATGLFNIGGPFLALYFFYGTQEPLEYKSTLSLNFAVTSLWTSVMHVAYGSFSTLYLPYIMVGLAGGAVGIKLSYHLFNKINRDMLGMLTYIMVAVMGLFLI